jgi:hypothetical protein
VRLLKKIKVYLLTLLGDIYFHGIFSPLWITVNPKAHKLKGEHYRSVHKIIKPGDVLLRRFDGYVDKFFIPGFFNHAGIYIGGEHERVIHSMSEGVITEDILNFMRTDYMVILRPKSHTQQAILKALSFVGFDYDFDFELGEKTIYCSELISLCYPGTIWPTRHYGKEVILPDDILNCSFFSVVWDSRTTLTTTQTIKWSDL